MFLTFISIPGCDNNIETIFLYCPQAAQIKGVSLNNCV